MAGKKQHATTLTQKTSTGRDLLSTGLRLSYDTEYEPTDSTGTTQAVCSAFVMASSSY